MSMATLSDIPTSRVKSNVGGPDARLQGFLQTVRMVAPTRLGTQIRALRRAAGMTQAVAADAIGITRSTLASFYHVALDALQAGTLPPRAPGSGEFVDDPDELALLSFWRELNEAERATMLRLLRVEGRAAA